MKMLIIIVEDNDAFAVIDELNEKGFYVTKLASTGGFLRSGKTTLICGVNKDRIPDLVEIVKKKCKVRKQLASSDLMNLGTTDTHISFPIEISVGGATIFSLNVEEFIRV